MAETPANQRALRIGTRASKLARWQAEWVAAQLRSRGLAAELIEITTRGDADAATPIADIGAPGVFTKAIQNALLAGEVDLAVHSLKDLPTDTVGGLMLAAVPARESAADVLVLPSGRVAGVELLASPQAINLLRARPSLNSSHPALEVLPNGARVGTGSLRRQAQLWHARPDLRVAAVRGNVDTRLRKLAAGECDALILAEAGLQRLGLASCITQVLSADVMLPAVGQGALGIECRAGDVKTQADVQPLDDWESRAAVTAERALLAHLRGGCFAPIGAWGRFENGALRLSAVVLSPDGQRRLEAHDAAVGKGVREAEALGQRVAEALLAQGAAELIATSRGGHG